MDVREGGSAGNQPPAAGNSVQGALATPTFRYDAFISYSHAADGQLAPALRNGLQRFATAWRVFRWKNPIRALRIFQDQASLSANPALWPTIENALDSAEWFILLASPEAANSPWVEQEIDFWRRNKPIERLLIVQSDGDIAWDHDSNDFDWIKTTALPRRLSTVFADEPRWIEARWARTGAQTSLRDPRFRDLVAELAAPLRGVHKDELIGEDIRQHRRLNRWRNAAFGTVTTLLIGAVAAAAIAVQQREAAIAQRNEALRNRSRALATLADMESERGSPAVAVRIALAALPQTLRGPYVAEAELALYRALERNREVGRLTGHQRGVMAAVFSPDGRSIVTTGADSMRTWDGASGKELTLAGPPEAGSVSMPRTAAFSSDGRTIVTGGLDGRVRVWDADTLNQKAVMQGHEDVVFAVDVSPDGHTVASSSNDKTARLWDMATGQARSILHGHSGPVLVIAFGPDGRTVLTAAIDGTARLWDVSTGKEIRVFDHGKNAAGPTAAAITPDGRTIATASAASAVPTDGHVIHIWDVATGAERALLRGHANQINSLQYSRDGRLLVSASFDRTARVWDAESGKQVAVLRDMRTPLLGARFSPDGHSIVTTGDMETNIVKLWNPTREALVLHGHQGRVRSAHFDADGRRIITASLDKTIGVWDAATGQEILSLQGHEGGVHDARFSPDGTKIISASEDHTARIWDLGSRKETAILRGHMAGVISATFSTDGKNIFTTSLDETMRVWDVAGQFLRQNVAPQHTMLTRISGDARIVGVTDASSQHLFWDLEAKKPLPLLSGHRGAVNAGVLSDDRKMIATASFDATARLWNAETGQEILVLRGHDGFVYDVAFSHDGHTLATAGADNARLWDVITGQELAVFQGHTYAVETVEFSPDGRRLVTASADGTARIWPVLPRGQELIDLACARVPWPLSEDQKQRFGISEEWCTPEVAAALREKLGL